MTTNSSSNIANNVPYLRTTRQFPTDDPTRLANELTRSWNETSNCVNLREIAIFDLAPIITGQQWFANSDTSNTTNLPKRQGFRYVYSISSFSSFTHSISGPTLFTHIYGGFTDGTNFYPLPYISPTAAQQVGVYCSQTQVVFNAGGSAPSITGGIIVLEYLLQ